MTARQKRRRIPPSLSEWLLTSRVAWLSLSGMALSVVGYLVGRPWLSVVGFALAVIAYGIAVHNTRAAKKRLATILEWDDAFRGNPP